MVTLPYLYLPESCDTSFYPHGTPTTPILHLCRTHVESVCMNLWSPYHPHPHTAANYLPHPVRVVGPLSTQDVQRLVGAEPVEVELLVPVGRDLRTDRFPFLIWVTLRNIATRLLTAL